MKQYTFIFITMIFGFASLSCNPLHDISMTAFYFPGEVNFQNEYTLQDMKHDCLVLDYTDTIIIKKECYQEFMRLLTESEQNSCNKKNIPPDIYVELDTCNFFLNVKNSYCEKKGENQNQSFILNEETNCFIKLITGYSLYTDSTACIKGLLSQEYSADILKHFKERKQKLLTDEEEPEEEWVKLLILVK